MACINSILLRTEANTINQRITIRTRDNKGGIMIDETMDGIPVLDIDWSKMYYIIYIKVRKLLINGIT